MKDSSCSTVLNLFRHIFCFMMHQMASDLDFRQVNSEPGLFYSGAMLL